MLSIDKHGIQVPITVYKDGDIYTLLDGERRWRCARKLNLRAIPAIVQNKPTELENLVLMYNIHSLREQWDYYTIASKLERVCELYEREKGNLPNEIVLSELTGLTRGAIRRCQLLIDLPVRFKRLLLEELDKPKSQQRLSEDFFIEMEKALKTVVRRMDIYEPRINEIRDTLVSKFRSGAISAVTDFRQLSKIATAVDGLGISTRTAMRALDRIFDPKNNVGIKDAYTSAVEFQYDEKKASRQVSSLVNFLDTVAYEDQINELGEDLTASLRELYDRLKKILER